MIDLLINKTDFENVRKISEHCTYDALTPYIRERQNIDFIDKLGNSFYFDVIKNRDEDDYKNLLDGCDYVNCDGNTVEHFGLKRALVHYSYASYILEHGYTDSQFGAVQKINHDSMPVPMVELRKLHDRNIRLGNDYLRITKDYLCHNKELFPLYDQNCSCNCNKIKVMKTRTNTFSVIKKKR